MRKESLLVLDQQIKYRVRISERALRLRIAVYADGDVVVTRPKGMPMERIRKFIELKKMWILRRLEENRTSPITELRETDKSHFEKYHDEAKSLVMDKIKTWNSQTEYAYKSISVKPLKSRWGSCSRQGNLSFNYKILFLPDRLQDYVIVHELCHLMQPNHSIKFWSLVEKTLPNYQELSKMIKSV